MTLLTATVTDERLLPPPQEVQAQFQPGQRIQIQLDQEMMTGQETPVIAFPAPNRKALAALQEIDRRQAGRRHTDGSHTDQLLRDGRSGAMYGATASE